FPSFSSIPLPSRMASISCLTPWLNMLVVAVPVKIDMGRYGCLYDFLQCILKVRRLRGIRNPGIARDVPTLAVRMRRAPRVP
ncbi:hypothetical protein EDD15DRAFT_2265323, partial [Pisolithus albus]